ncbi:MAG: response regulator transcription factor [Bacteroidota bacterium]
MDQIRIAIVDDHTLVRSGVGAILESESRMQVELSLPHGQALLDAWQEHSLDVILLDLEMPVLGGRETLERIREMAEDVRVIILTMHDHEGSILQMMELGANGYLVKDAEPEEVIEAVVQVYTSGYYFSDRVARAMLGSLKTPDRPSPAHDSIEGLSPREVDVLRLICQEHTTAEIAESLFLSPKTIEGYRKTLMEKTQARNMAGMVLFAIRHGLIEV